ncbi:phosphonatase-like hydrolase [Brevibacterium sanguinis]|uniref:Phosphonatase-like hydrolase n=2 Tax=Brevibacterium TaxID=1696 RepID=A0A366IMW2_9MICO|nr:MULTISPECIES: phosphonatase-like hydrolase [Brevibacterium]RBP68178.1 phosphonatase-like hydrolase [Brevibacterium sanguinis]RBP74405.1 phosphonatase-like hydrolase [Brevibacterium celere]
MTSIALAAFDMAGTTLDEHGDVYRALQRSVESTGTAVSAEDLQTWMGADKVEAIRNLLRLGGHAGDEATVSECFDLFRRLLRDFYAANPPTPLPGVEEALRALRASGVRVALTTGFSTDVAGLLLDGLGWSTGEGGNLDAVVCSDEVAAGRPYPYMIHRAMERTGVQDVRSVLVAGDTIVDVEAGVASGAGIVLGVHTGKLGPEDFARTAATASLPSVAEVPAHLGLDAEVAVAR